MDDTSGYGPRYEGLLRTRPNTVVIFINDWVINLLQEVSETLKEKHPEMGRTTVQEMVGVIFDEGLDFISNYSTHRQNRQEMRHVINRSDRWMALAGREPENHRLIELDEEDYAFLTSILPNRKRKKPDDGCKIDTLATHIFNSVLLWACSDKETGKEDIARLKNGVKNIFFLHTEQAFNPSNDYPLGDDDEDD